MVVMTDASRRTVVLVRHAKAESGEEGSDHDRRLTKRGRTAAADAGRWLAGRVPAADLVWCSSATRAVQTWEAMATALDATEVRVDRELYLASPRDVVDRVVAGSEATTVVVGHNPTVEQVLAALVGELRGMRPGAVAVVDLDGGTLLDFWEPAR
jgi:phosphohistidine phosphatase